MRTGEYFPHIPDLTQISELGYDMGFFYPVPDYDLNTKKGNLLHLGSEEGIPVSPKIYPEIP